MKTLVYKINADIADNTAKEFGLSIIDVERLYSDDEYFGIRFESYYDDVVVEYDDTVRVGNTFDTSYEVSSGIVTVPKSNQNAITRTSTGGALIWFPYNGKTKVQIKVHNAHKVGGFIHTSHYYPTPPSNNQYGRAHVTVNLLDMMNLVKLITTVNFTALMEDKSFDLRNLVYFQNLKYLNAALNTSANTIWLPKKSEETFDMNWMLQTNYPFTVDNETFNRRFEYLSFSGFTMVGSVTDLSGFKVHTLYMTDTSYADMFASLLPNCVDPFFNNCSIHLNVDSAITTEQKDDIYDLAHAVGGKVYFDYNSSTNEWTEYIK